MGNNEISSLWEHLESLALNLYKGSYLSSLQECILLSTLEREEWQERGACRYGAGVRARFQREDCRAIRRGTPSALRLFRSKAVRKEPEGKTISLHACQAVLMSSYLTRIQKDHFNNILRENQAHNPLLANKIKQKVPRYCPHGRPVSLEREKPWLLA